ncbi:uncharacterized protein E5676_scaffold588G00110 [Cucumis melo var. makuwa]|uniref:Uncharacterized protein n=1 Tax=Cucumis melo var. makuwa TaxID=1194695 RepID=A0A5D3E1G5_CUCMM|nr:uncharacterized protein E5676_scaffold588G00110 [Cucumis melo var. makuwa]
MKEKEEKEINSVDETKRGETFSRCLRCLRRHEPAVVPLPPFATAHPYLRGDSRIACKVALLEKVVKLMHVRVLNGWSNKPFDMLLNLLRAVFPMCSSTILSSFYEVKRKLCDLDLGYKTIHACKYDCVLYWKEFAHLQHCPTCDEAQYKDNHNKWKKKFS